MKASHKAVFAVVGTTLLAQGCAHDTSHQNGPQFQAIPIKSVSGETIVFQDEVRLHKEVVSTEVATETAIPARTVPAVTKATYKTVCKTDVCGKEYTAKVPTGEKVLTPAQVIPATIAVEKTTTTVTTTSEEPIKGGAAIGGLRYANGSATDSNLINVATRVDSEGNIREMEFTPIATDLNFQQITRGFNDVATPFANVGAAALIADGIRDSASNITNQGGNAESNANAEGGQGGAGGQGGDAYAKGGDAYAEGGKAISNSDSKSFSNAEAKSNSFSNANAQNTNNNLNINKNNNQNTNNNLNLNKNNNQNTNNNLNLNKNNNNNMNLNKNQVDVKTPSHPGSGSHNKPPKHGYTR